MCIVHVCVCVADRCVGAIGVRVCESERESDHSHTLFSFTLRFSFLSVAQSLSLSVNMAAILTAATTAVAAAAAANKMRSHAVCVHIECMKYGICDEFRMAAFVGNREKEKERERDSENICRCVWAWFAHERDRKIKTVRRTFPESMSVRERESRRPLAMIPPYYRYCWLLNQRAPVYLRFECACMCVLCAPYARIYVCMCVCVMWCMRRSISFSICRWLKNTIHSQHKSHT